MSVIDDNKYRLLKMKEKLLEVSVSDRNAILNDYKKIAYDIDKDLYKSIADKLKNSSDYFNYPLEKQLEVLSDIDKEFSEYCEFRDGIRLVCEKYGDFDLRLSDVTIINIDEIRKRIKTIKSYLSNVGEIKELEVELDKLNSNLIAEDKKNNIFKRRIDGLNEELKQSLLKAEGRIYDASGGLVYANTLNEAEKLDIDLKKIVFDEELLKSELKTAFSDLSEVEDRLKTAQICYNNVPNANYKEVYWAIRDEAIRKKYRLIFLEIVDLICKSDGSYAEAKDKRARIVSLIKCRRELLNQINVVFLYDPFDRLGIKEQLEVIEAYGDNSNKIKEIRSKMTEVNAVHDKKVTENMGYVDYFEMRTDLFADDTLFSDIVDRLAVGSLNTGNAPVPSKKISQNRVIKLSSLPIEFMLNRSLEKARGVASKVCEIINNPYAINSTIPSKPSDSSPNLVIESTPVTFETAVEDEKDDVFLDLPVIDDSVSNPLSDNEIVVDKKDDVELFQEVEPFETAALFGDKYDDGTVLENAGSKNNLFVDLGSSTGDTSNIMPSIKLDDTNVEMPDAFWTTSDEPVDEVKEDGLSLDEQLNALIASDSKEESKVKKLVS